MLAEVDAGTKPRHQDRIVVLTVVAYVHLWILEGAIRKWVPGSEQVLYVARDGLVLAVILMLGLGPARRSRSAPVFWAALLSLSVLVCVQTMMGRIDLPVAAVGIRSYIAPVLLVYVAWCYPVHNLWHQILKAVAAYAPFQAALTIGQVLSPARSFINKEVGSDAASFVNDSVVRASGTFSAPSGLALYVPLALAASLYLVYKATGRARWIWAAAVVSLFITALVSGSRGMVLAVAIILAAFFLYHLSRIAHGGIGNVLFTAFAGLLCIFGIQWWLPEVVDSFLGRFANAARSENSSTRLLEQTFGFFDTPFRFLGDGAGAHSVAGINLGSAGPWIEVETIKWVSELGLSGWILSWGRLYVCLLLVTIVLIRLRALDLAFVMTVAAFVPVLLFGHVTQYPSAQGFTSICLALLVLIGKSETPAAVYSKCPSLSRRPSYSRIRSELHGR